jgi:hypothetical protein
MHSPAPGVFHTVIVGYTQAEEARQIIAAGDRVIAEAGMLVAFHDWEAMTGYHTESRVLLTEWGLRIRAQVEKVHVLVRSRVVAMGVSVASLVLRGMLVSYTQRAAFEAAFARRLKEASPSI